MKKLLFLSILTCSLFAGSISISEASNYIGERKTVCGKVVSTHYAENSNGSPTFLNLDIPYPNNIFTAVIFGEYRNNFNQPENYYKFKSICVKGKISEYRGTPQIVVRTKSQISVK